MKNAFPPVIIGSGLAGLTVALALAPRPVIVLTRGKAGEKSSSLLAQGGIAAAMGPDDSYAFHTDDTMQAGAGLCDYAIVRMVTRAAPAAIDQLIRWGVAFDRDEFGQLDLGLEGAHSRRRIVHANGDSTGAVVTKTLAARASATASITVLDGSEALDLTTDDRGVTGVTFIQRGIVQHIASPNVILATGGAGALWPHTTTPQESWGKGLVLAARAGANLRDIEFMQFHPTGIDTGFDPVPLASESLRGEGAQLVNDAGDNIMAPFPHGALEPRDIVARAIQAELSEGRRVFLDVRMIAAFAARFPSVYALCQKAGIDPVHQLLPVRPTAHYHMGGVAVDACGRTNIEGLWACGETASSGLHGANRLASNSLLEAVVFGYRIAETLLDAPGRDVTAPRVLSPLPPAETPDENKTIRAIMGEHVGVTRNKTGLEKAIDLLKPLSARSEKALMARMIAFAALTREESRGAHMRTDFPAMAPEARHQVIDLHALTEGSVSPDGHAHINRGAA